LQVAQVLLTLPYSFSQLGMLSGVLLQIFYGILGSWTAYIISVLYVEYRSRKEKEGVSFKNHVIQVWPPVSPLAPLSPPLPPYIVITVTDCSSLPPFPHVRKILLSFSGSVWSCYRSAPAAKMPRFLWKRHSCTHAFGSTSCF
jgi:hypothetical protein